ncbi:MAG TPA: DUF6677 family protein [Thermoanaerobaculia bacterium]|jgi:hypothetical protein|nr:DUF6677 family protein [Thermoanaerobaculia bacterium]
MTARAILSMVLAFAVPGLGHLYLGRRARAAAFFAIVVFMFAIGFAVEGGLYTVKQSGGTILRVLASYASMGSGLLYALGLALGKPGNVVSSTYEYGRTFTLTAGLMNLLLVLDCWDIARGRKP